MNAVKESNNKRFYLIFKKWRMMDALGSLFALIGLVLAMACYEVDVSWSESYGFTCHQFDEIIEKNYNVMNLPEGFTSVPFFDTQTLLMRWLIFLTSIISSGFFIKRHMLKLEWTNNDYRRQLNDGLGKSNTNMRFYYNQMLSARDRDAAMPSKNLRNPLHPKMILN